MPKIEEELDWQVYFNKDSDNPTPYHWERDGKPLTFRSAYTELQKLKLKSLKRRQRFTNEETKKIIEDRKLGLSIRRLAEKYQCSTRTIQKYLKKCVT